MLLFCFSPTSSFIELQFTKQSYLGKGKIFCFKKHFNFKFTYCLSDFNASLNVTCKHCPVVNADFMFWRNFFFKWKITIQEQYLQGLHKVTYHWNLYMVANSLTKLFATVLIDKGICFIFVTTCGRTCSILSFCAPLISVSSGQNHFANDGNFCLLSFIIIVIIKTFTERKGEWEIFHLLVHSQTGPVAHLAAPVPKLSQKAGTPIWSPTWEVSHASTVQVEWTVQDRKHLFCLYFFFFET